MYQPGQDYTVQYNHFSFIIANYGRVRKMQKIVYLEFEKILLFTFSYSNGNTGLKEPKRIVQCGGNMRFNQLIFLNLIFDFFVLMFVPMVFPKKIIPSGNFQHFIHLNGVLNSNANCTFKQKRKKCVLECGDTFTLFMY